MKLNLLITDDQGREWEKQGGGRPELAEKNFKTGSRGFSFQGKIVDPVTGKRYQASWNLVEIGSKGGK